jgi:hypothetical protein
MALRSVGTVLLAVGSLYIPGYGQAAVARSKPKVAVQSMIPATTSAINSETPLSQRVVWYNIDARYDPRTHQLDGSEVLTYHNLTGQPQDHFPFHLYLNGFQPKATWIREARAEGTRDVEYRHWKPEEFGSDEIERFEVVGMGDLTANLHYIQPDDGNKDDKTVIEAVLPKAVEPGEFVQFKIKFHDKFPETQARTGWKRDFTLGGQWFPKVGVWWQGAWNCHQFHATTEFFADFGVYDVKLTVPQNEIAGASGILAHEENNSDGTKTLTFHGDDIHDFAWTVSPRYKVGEDTYQGTMGPVHLRLLMQPAHWDQEARHARILKETLEHFEKWYGPYPYKTLTLVDPEPGSAAGGMEYPTFITGDSTWWMPEGLRLPELVVEHEFGHQYWYAMVATNEFEDAWLDEGINSYTEVKILDDILGRNTSVIDMFGLTAGDRDTQRLQYIAADDLDPMARKGWQFASFNSYGGITYGKTASVLLTLEKVIGEDTMRKALHTYFMRYRFTHPTKEDFLKTVEEVAGQNLRWYFDQAVYGTQAFDYEVMSIASRPADWYEAPKQRKRGGEVEYESTVMLHRKGDFIFPVDALITFDDRTKVREHWDGQDRWIRFHYLRKAKVASAEIDPDHRIQLDRDNFNNSRTREANLAPARKLANYWAFVTQWLAQFLAWWTV